MDGCQGLRSRLDCLNGKGRALKLSTTASSATPANNGAIRNAAKGRSSPDGGDVVELQLRALAVATGESENESERVREL